MTQPNNPFTPDLKKFIHDIEAIGRTAHFMADGSFYTTKQIQKPTAFLNDIIKQEKDNNIFMHEDQDPFKDTYDAYVNLNTFTAYENNVTDKLNFLKINLRKCKGFVEVYHAAKEK